MWKSSNTEFIRTVQKGKTILKERKENKIKLEKSINRKKLEANMKLNQTWKNELKFGKTEGTKQSETSIDTNYALRKEIFFQLKIIIKIQKAIDNAYKSAQRADQNHNYNSITSSYQQTIYFGSEVVQFLHFNTSFSIVNEEESFKGSNYKFKNNFYLIKWGYLHEEKTPRTGKFDGWPIISLKSLSRHYQKFISNTSSKRCTGIFENFPDNLDRLTFYFIEHVTKKFLLLFNLKFLIETSLKSYMVKRCIENIKMIQLNDEKDRNDVKTIWINLIIGDKIF
jgi:hypothetical protein